MLLMRQRPRLPETNKSRYTNDVCNPDNADNDYYYDAGGDDVDIDMYDDGDYVEYGRSMAIIVMMMVVNDNGYIMVTMMKITIILEMKISMKMIMMIMMMVMLMMMLMPEVMIT